MWNDLTFPVRFSDVPFPVTELKQLHGVNYETAIKANQFSLTDYGNGGLDCVETEGHPLAQV